MSKGSISIERQLGLLTKNDGVDIRNPSTAILGISSIDRYKRLTDGERNPTNLVNPTSPYDFTIQTSGQPFMSGFFTRMAVSEVRFPWTMPTITARNQNMRIVYDDGTGPVNYTLTINNGWYDPTALAAELETQIQINTGNAGFTVTWTGAGKYQFAAASNNGDTFYFQRLPPPTAAPLTNMITVFEMMAWDNNQVLAISQVSGTTVNLLSTQFVDIVCENLTLNQSLKDGDTSSQMRDTLCRIYLAPDGFNGDPTLLGSEPFIIQRQFTFPKQIKWSANQNIGNMRFIVYDDQGYALSTYEVGSGNNADYNQGNWNMTLLVSEV